MIRKAAANDIPRITEIYKNVIHSDTNMTRWSEDVYPTADTACKALTRGDLFVYEDDAAGRVLATAIINQIQGDAYSKCSWRFPAADNEVMVLHTLAVDPEASHKGIGKQILKFYEEYALDKGCKVLRMDTGKQNTIARGFYEKSGFIESGLIHGTVNGIDDTWLIMLEKKIV